MGRTGIEIRHNGLGISPRMIVKLRVTPSCIVEFNRVFAFLRNSNTNHSKERL
jgi:hypothetical protein